MKMSDYFSLPVKADDCYRVVCDDGIIIAEDIVSNEEIAHAINMHDELVEALESMLQSYGEDGCRFVRGCCQEHFDLTGDGNCYIGRAKEILEKAKS